MVDDFFKFAWIDQTLFTKKSLSLMTYFPAAQDIRSWKNNCEVFTLGFDSVTFVSKHPDFSAKSFFRAKLFSNV